MTLDTASGTALRRADPDGSRSFVKCQELTPWRGEAGALGRWADDLKLGLEREIKDLDQEIKEVRRESQAATALTEKLVAQKKLRAVENQRNKNRRELYDAQDAIDHQRDELIGKIERQLNTQHTMQPLFAVRWEMV